MDRVQEDLGGEGEWHHRRQNRPSRITLDMVRRLDRQLGITAEVLLAS